MKIEFTGYEIDKKNGEIYIFANNLDAVEAAIDRRESADHFRVPEVTFRFACIDHEHEAYTEQFRYLNSWLKRQLKVKTSAPKTWGEALRCCIGITTIAPASKYRYFPA